MNYKVQPISVSISARGNAGDVSAQVESAISQQASNGWEFVSCGNIDTSVAGSNGCFGLGAKPATNTSVLVLIFKQ
jgi:hypothetical protein